MYDIITFGSATRDIFLQSKSFRIVGEKKFVTGKGICLSLGSKIDVKDIFFLIGGGGTNTAATFSNQGLKVAYCGMIGDDPAGDEVLEELKKFKIDDKFVLRTKKKITNHSVILSSNKKETTILVYRGAAGELSRTDIPWSEIKAKWIYIAPLSGKLVAITEYLISFAKKKGIKVALNPGNSQLSLPAITLKRILKQVDILILNQEEASILTKIPYEKERDIFSKIDELTPGICCMTKGPQGVVVSDGLYLYRANSLRIKPVDWTGAGDSFASGFLSGLIQSKGNIEYGVQLGIANSSACLTQFGAKHGLLKKEDKWKMVKVKKETCSLNNRCLPK